MAYGYIYPAMNKATPGRGRVIRTPTDEGIIVLLDNRYRTPPTKNAYPHAHICFDAQPFGKTSKVLGKRKECQKGVEREKKETAFVRESQCI